MACVEPPQAAQEPQTRPPESSNSVSWLPSWKPTSEQLMEDAEKKILKGLTSEYRDMHVPVGPDTYIHTVMFDAINQPSNEPAMPLVMIHGFGCGIPQYYKNYDHLHDTRAVYSLDLPGFARSTRVDFSADAEQCEKEYVEYIEKWRQAMGLDKFILLGHSLGGFLSCAYTLSYPQHVRHLVLDDPWGMPARQENGGQLPLWVQAVSFFLSRFNPLGPVRLSGPLGPYLIHRLRPDLGRKFGRDFMDYVYHVNAQKPSGETAFFHMQISFGWARCPMLSRIPTQMCPSVPISLIYGAHSWMDSSSGELLKELRPNSYTAVHCVSGAGHHVHADQPELFNKLVTDICSLVDSNLDC